MVRAILLTLMAVLPLGLFWLVVIGRDRLDESPGWRRVTLVYLGALLVVGGVVVGLQLSLEELSARNEMARVDPPATPVEPGFIGEDLVTETCHFSDLRVAKAASTYVGHPLEVSLEGSAEATDPAPGQAADALACEVTVTLTTVDPELSVVGRDVVVVDLATSTPTWLVVAETSGTHTFSLEVTTTAECVSGCRVPRRIPMIVLADPDLAYTRARDAVRELSDGLEIQLEQSYPLRADTAETLDVGIALPDSVPLRDLDELALVLRSEHPWVQAPPEPIPIDTTQPYDSVIHAPIVVTAGGRQDFSFALTVDVVGKRGDDPITAFTHGIIPIEVTEATLLHRVVVANIVWVAPTVGVVAMTGTGLIRFVRWIRRRKKSDTEPIGDERSYL